MIYIGEVEEKLKKMDFTNISLQECKVMVEIFPIQVAGVLKLLVPEKEIEGCYFCLLDAYKECDVNGTKRTLCEIHYHQWSCYMDY